MRTLDDEIRPQDTHGGDTHAGLCGAVCSAEAGEYDGARAAHRSEERLSSPVSMRMFRHVLFAFRCFCLATLKERIAVTTQVFSGQALRPSHGLGSEDVEGWCNLRHTRDYVHMNVSIGSLALCIARDPSGFQARL